MGKMSHQEDSLRKVSKTNSSSDVRKSDKSRKSRPDKESRNLPPVPDSDSPNSVANSRLEVPTNSIHDVEYDNGVPHIVCSIPLMLIDQLPTQLRVEKSDKVIKHEVRPRTKTKKIVKNSPPNEENTKKRAIVSIFKSRKPDKAKRDVRSSEEERTPKRHDFFLFYGIRFYFFFLYRDPKPEENVRPGPSTGSTSTQKKHKKDKKSTESLEVGYLFGLAFVKYSCFFFLRLLLLIVKRKGKNGRSRLKWK